MNMIERYTARVTAGDLTRDTVQEAVLPEFQRILEGLSAVPAKPKWFKKKAAPKVPRGLYLWGGVGRGKSMLMDLFVEALDVPNRRVHFHAFMQEIHAGLHAARVDGVQDALSPVIDRVVSDAKVLAFDEMQITDITDAMIVGRLFEALFAAGVVVVTTSNRVPDDLYRNGLNRQLFLPFIAILKEHMVVHELFSPTDYRQDRLAGSPVYFTPNDDAARAAMDHIWVDLTGGQTAPHTIIVNKREVTLPEFHNGVGRASFADLCAQPLGPADYLAVAKTARVLMVDDIPRLSRKNAAEAKRFVTLIDTLYEAKVRLICSAEAEPEALYVAGEGSFEFERTASRLREMQAEDWGRT